MDDQKRRFWPFSFDLIIERGGAIAYGGVRIDFSQVPQVGTSEFTVPTNIGVSGQPVAVSSALQDLDRHKLGSRTANRRVFGY